MKKHAMFVAQGVCAITLLSSTGLTLADNNLATVGSQWAAFEQTTLPNGKLNFRPAVHADTIPTGGVQFPMPNATGPSPTFVNYMLNNFTVSLTEGSTISATINVVGTSGVPGFLGDTFGGFNLAQPAFVRLFVEANLPSDGSATCVGGNQNGNNFWWADVNFYTFTPGGSGGPITLTVSLDPANWSGICGNPASANTAGFDLALANIKQVGLSFGSGFFFASGVGVDGTTGTANFQLLDYTITP